MVSICTSIAEATSTTINEEESDTSKTLPEQELQQCLEQQGDDILRSSWQSDDWGVVQDLGRDKVPPNIQFHIHQTVCEMIYYWQTQVVSKEECRLVTCHNQQPLCAFWAWRGQCTATDYQDYMERHCPLACQICHSDAIRGRALLQYLEELQQLYDEDNDGDTNVVSKRQRVLLKIMQDLQVWEDQQEKVLSNNNQSQIQTELLVNDMDIVVRLNRRIQAVVPTVLSKLYTTPTQDSSKVLSQEETELLHQIHQYGSQPPPSMLPYRDRGSMIATFAMPFDHLVTRPMQLSIGFAIPHHHAIQALLDLNMPLVEMGAGTGYWTAVLQQNGASIVAYDTSIDQDNAFFDIRYTNTIQQGSCTSILLQKQPQLAATHALLLVWPNDPDPVDHPQYCHPDCQSSQSVWDAACLEAYLKQGGQTVIYVGERQATLSAKYGTTESGQSSTRRFQQLLQDQFELQRTISIPQLWLNEDDMTIWQRRRTVTNEEL